MRKRLLTIFLLGIVLTVHAGNPFIPGYFADPTIRKFGNTYYLYATTDGTGNGYGPAQVWVSKDFVNWRNYIMNWPTSEVVWAPDVVQQSDGTYRYYYCEPCNINVGESTSPIGPWHNILGKDDAVLVPDRYIHNVITLDPQLFRDDDGSEYLYFTTWGIYKGFGCGVAKLSEKGKANNEKWAAAIPHSQARAMTILTGCSTPHRKSDLWGHSSTKVVSSRPMPTRPFMVRDITAY